MLNLTDINKSLTELFWSIYTGFLFDQTYIATSHHYFTIRMGSCLGMGYVKCDVWGNRKCQIIFVRWNM